jgi:hypothetical protein
MSATVWGMALRIATQRAAFCVATLTVGKGAGELPVAAAAMGVCAGADVLLTLRLSLLLLMGRVHFEFCSVVVLSQDFVLAVVVRSQRLKLSCLSTKRIG